MFEFTERGTQYVVNTQAGVCDPPTERETRLRALEFEIAHGVAIVKRAYEEIGTDEAIADALEVCEWGPQPGGYFVCKGSGWPQIAPWRELHAPNKRGVLVRVVTSERGYVRVTRFTPQEAWAKRQELRAERRRCGEQYERECARVVAVILGKGQTEWRDGQEGGVIRVPGGPWCSWRGVMKRLGCALANKGTGCQVAR